jgi:hypothetical protein
VWGIFQSSLDTGQLCLQDLPSTDLYRASLKSAEGIAKEPKEEPGGNGRPNFSNHQRNENNLSLISSWLFLGLLGNPFD